MTMLRKPRVYTSSEARDYVLKTPKPGEKIDPGFSRPAQAYQPGPHRNTDALRARVQDRPALAGSNVSPRTEFGGDQALRTRTNAPIGSNRFRDAPHTRLAQEARSVGELAGQGAWMQERAPGDGDFGRPADNEPMSIMERRAQASHGMAARLRAARDRANAGPGEQGVLNMAPPGEQTQAAPAPAPGQPAPASVQTRRSGLAGLSDMLGGGNLGGRTAAAAQGYAAGSSGLGDPAYGSGSSGLTAENEDTAAPADHESDGLEALADNLGGSIGGQVIDAARKGKVSAPSMAAGPTSGTDTASIIADIDQKWGSEQAEYVNALAAAGKLSATDGYDLLNRGYWFEHNGDGYDIKGNAGAGEVHDYVDAMNDPKLGDFLAMTLGRRAKADPGPVASGPTEEQLADAELKKQMDALFNMEVSQFDQDTIDANIRADRQKNAFDTARAMRANMEAASRAQASPEYSSAQMSQLGMQSDLAANQQATQQRLQYEVQNQQAKIQQYQTRAQALLASAGMAHDNATRARMFEQAKTMLALGTEAQKQLLEYQKELNKKSFWDVLGGIFGNAASSFAGAAGSAAGSAVFGPAKPGGG